MAGISWSKSARTEPFIVDSGSGKLTDKILAEIRRLSPKPIRYIVNTDFHAAYTGGNAKLKNAGSDPSVVGTFLALQDATAGTTATIMAHENVAARMNGSLGNNPPTPSDSWPLDTYLADRRRTFHNGDSIEMFYVPSMRAPMATASSIFGERTSSWPGDILNDHPVSVH